MPTKTCTSQSNLQSFPREVPQECSAVAIKPHLECESHPYNTLPCLDQTSIIRRPPICSIHSLLNLLKYILLLYYFTLVNCKASAAYIPGCLDLRTFQKVNTYRGIFCFCNIKENDLVTVNCLYGSNMEHFRNASELVTNANRSIDEVWFNLFRCYLTIIFNVLRNAKRVK